MTEIRDGHIRPQWGNWFRIRRASLIRLAFVAVATVFLLGNRGCCDYAFYAMDCDDIEVTVVPGTCVEFDESCFSSRGLDGFWLCPTDEDQAFLTAAQVSILTNRSGEQTTRSICTSADAPHFRRAIKYIYSRGDQVGTDFLFLTVTTPLAVELTATPSTVQPGESAQLTARVSGGVPPYEYRWDHDFRSLGSTSIVTPGGTTTYRVRVQDSLRETAVEDTVTVFVGLGLNTTATPQLIETGQSSQLNAIAFGGAPPYSYSWQPADTLSDSRLSNPVATPIVTTTYRVTVSDSAGATRQGSATVTVNSAGPPPPTASFVHTVVCCPTINVDASASTGNIVDYTWDLSWTLASPDLVTSSPLAAFPINETNRGTITLTVRDAVGRSATITRNFP